MSAATADCALNILRVRPEARRSCRTLAKAVGIHPAYAAVVLRHLESQGKIRRRGRPGPGCLPEVEVTCDGYVEPCRADAAEARTGHPLTPIDEKLVATLQILARDSWARRNISVLAVMVGETQEECASLLNRLAFRGKILFHNRGLPKMRVVVVDPYFDFC